MDWTFTPLFVHVVSPVLNTIRPPSWSELGVYFAAIVAVCGVIYTATATRRTGQEANAINFNKNLLDRVATLEKKDEEKDAKIDELSSVMSVSVSYIESLIRWGRGGARPPEPTAPHELQDRLSHLIRPKEDA